MHGEDSGSDFAEFARAEAPRLVRLARLLCGNDHDAWDLTQEALIRVGMRWHAVDFNRDPSAYTRKCLVNLYRNRGRRAMREILMPAVPDRAVDEDRSRLEGPDAWLDAALQSLPTKQRAAVTLAYFEDQSVRDIARALACSESAAKTHLSRGRAALRAAAERHGVGADPKSPRSSDGNR
jgi:RNA polymerase sigma-70 factor (sigma-E family)